MTIYVIRGGQTIAASVFYNFRRAFNVIVVRLHKTFFTDQDDLVLIYDLADKKWTELNHLEENEPLFFEHVLISLKDLLNEAEKNLENSFYAKTPTAGMMR